jgi:uroporphyrinogen-III decarboxylase
VTEQLVKADEDVAAFVELPFAPKAPSAEEIEAQRAALGDRGVLELQVPTALCLVCENMNYEDFMVRTLTAPKHVFAMLERCQELVEAWLSAALENGAGPCFRLFGAEYAAPPMLPPSFFEEAVVRFDRRLAKMIHHYGGYARYHCHGRVRGILDYVMAMGMDLLDPCEAPPNGDITMDELARIVGDDVIIMGNVQLHDLETLRPADVDRLVANALQEVGGRCRHVLLPTASPIEVPLRKQTTANLKQFLDSAWARG